MGIAIKIRQNKYIDVHLTDGPFGDYSPSDKIVYYPETNMAILSICRTGILTRKTFFNVREMRDFFNTFDTFSKGMLVCILLQCIKN